MDKELREKVAQILTEPDIGRVDWEIGKYMLANWKANLPDQILAFIEEAGYRKISELPLLSDGELELIATGFDFAECKSEWRKIAQAQVDRIKKWLMEGKK